MEYIKHLGIVLPEKKTFFKTLLNERQAKTAYGLNEKVIASVVFKSRKGYSTEYLIFFFHFPVIMLVVK